MEEMILTLVFIALVVLVVMPIVTVILLAGQRKRSRAMWEKLGDLSLNIRGLREELTSLKRELKPSSPEHVEVKKSPQPKASMVVTVKSDETKAASDPLAQKLKTAHPKEPPVSVKEAPAAPRPKFPPVVLPSKLIRSPRKSSPVVENAREVMKKIWNWVLVGDRPEGVTFEFALASRWLLIAGIVAIVACVAYFLKWSIERELIGPQARVAISILVGAGMLVGGLRLLGRKYHLMGQGLMGGGVVTLYFSMYAAGPLYSVLPTPAVFALMILVTVTAGLLAVRTDSMLIAIIGILGGFITPVLLRTPELNLPVLYGYTLLLSIGILGMAYYKQWRLLNYIGFVCTYVLVLGSMSAYDKATDFPAAISFLTAFFVVHSTITYLYNIIRGGRSGVLEIIHVVANAIAYAGIGYMLIHDAHGRPWPCLLSLWLAVFYTVHLVVFLRKKLVDRALLTALIALAGVFAAWTLPLVLEKETLTICLSLLAIMFLWLGQKMNSTFLQNLAQLVYAVVFYRLLVLDMPRNFDMRPQAMLPAGDYWKQMIDRLWTFGLALASVIGGFFLQRRSATVSEELHVTEGSDTREFVPRSLVVNVIHGFVVLFVFLFLHLELNTMFQYCEPLRLPVLTILWCALAGYFLWRYLSAGGQATETGSLSRLQQFSFGAMSVVFVVLLIKLLAIDAGAWKLRDSFVYGIEYSLLYAGMRLIDYGAVLLVLFGVWSILVRRGREPIPAAVFGYAGLALLFVYATLEVNSLLYWRLRDFQGGGITILWSVFAIAFIAAGIHKTVRALRYLGLVLFVVVTGKVFLVDLQDMEMIYRVVAFLVVGIILLLGSFAYIYSDKKFTRQEDGDADNED